MPPKWVMKIPTTIVFFIIFWAGYNYVQNLINEQSKDVMAVGFSKIIIIAGLSGLCYMAVPFIKDDKYKSQFLVAGEKFSHSCLMIVQTVFLKYLTGYIFKWEFVLKIDWVKTFLEVIFATLYFVLGGYAVFFFVWGFDALNKHLWSRYEKRIVK
jgi:ABC-type iron transport system FetAB permease component